MNLSLMSVRFPDIRTQSIRDDMDAREIESLSMLSRGFAELKDTNSELAYNVVLDILQGINEYASFLPSPHSH